MEAAALQTTINLQRRQAEQQQRAARLSMDLANAVGQTAESIILDASSASDAFRGLAEAIIRAIVQALIIRPLVAGITGGFSELIPGFQQGGYAGRGPAVVGENGP